MPCGALPVRVSGSCWSWSAFRSWRSGSVGRAVADTSIRIDDDGEVLVKGPQVFTGYWRNDRATAEVFDADGWFHTGDIGMIDDEGFLHRGYFRRTASGLAPLSRVGDIWGEFSHRQFLEFGSEGAGRSSGFFVGSMTEFLDTEWPAEHGKPVGIQD